MRSVLPWAAALAGLVAVRLWRFQREVARARSIARRAGRFERRLASGNALLVVGDSLAVGVGAARPEDSIAGRIAARYPEVSIVNLGRSGARASEVMAQLRAAPRRQYVAVIIAVGANDAIALTQRSIFQRQLSAVYQLARRHSRVVVHAGAANIGGAPLFFWPLDRLLDWRMGRIRDVVHRTSRHHGVDFVDFFRPLAVDPFSRSPSRHSRYYGSDRVHPSSRTYAVCHRIIERRARLGSLLAPPRTG
jgi:lysophospholipase L1-like esterase